MYIGHTSKNALLTRRPRSLICYDLMYVKLDGRLESIKRIKLTSDSEPMLLHIDTETGKEEVYECPSESPNQNHFRKLLVSDLHIPSDIVWFVNKYLLI